MFYYTDDFIPTAERKINEVTGKYVIPKTGNLYECCASDVLQNHDRCLLCQILVEQTKICYVKFEIYIPNYYNVYMYGIPIDLKMNYLESIKKTMKRSAPDQEDEPLKFGSIKCPFHKDTHNSAIHNKNGTIYCFACCKLFKK